MGAVAHINPANALYNDRDLALIRRTVAADCNEDEFNLFIHMARALELDPLRRQVYAFVYNKGNAKKRRMSIVTGIDGFRSIAARTGDYRPDEDEPTYEIDAALKGPDNPIGLVKATVRVFKFSHGDWHKVTASAYWDEYAPISEFCPDGYKQVDTGETWPDGNPKKQKVANTDERIRKLDDSGQWAKMPRVMLAKVAEALALRKAWPDNFADVYSAEEVDRTKALDVSPFEAAEQGRIGERLEKVQTKDTILIQWNENAPLVPVPVGQLADKVFAFIRENKEEPSAIGVWADRNRYGLREFWARSPGDALAVKKAVEEATARLVTEGQ